MTTKIDQSFKKEKMRYVRLTMTCFNGAKEDFEITKKSLKKYSNTVYRLKSMD